MINQEYTSLSYIQNPEFNFYSQYTNEISNEPLLSAQEQTQANVEELTNGQAAIWSPLWAYLLLVKVGLARATTTIICKYLSEAPPAALASWKAQLSALVLIPFFVYQCIKMDNSQKTQFFKILLQLVYTGATFAIFLCTWVAGIRETSLARAFLLGTCTPPVMLAIGTCVLKLPISWAEIIGSGIGLLGGVLIEAGSKDKQKDSFMGDILCLLSAIFFNVYIIIGKRLCKIIPIFVYMFPVHLVSAILTTIYAIIQNSNEYGVMYCSVGYVYNKKYLIALSISAMFPDLIGQVILTVLLTYISPVSITINLSVEPVFGSLIGWLISINNMPGLMSWTGGFVVITAAITLIACEHKKRIQQLMQLESIMTTNYTCYYYSEIYQV